MRSAGQQGRVQVRAQVQDSPSALKASRIGAAISSSTDDSILRSPSITHGV